MLHRGWKLQRWGSAVCGVIDAGSGLYGFPSAYTGQLRSMPSSPAPGADHDARWGCNSTSPLWCYFCPCYSAVWCLDSLRHCRRMLRTPGVIGLGGWGALETGGLGPGPGCRDPTVYFRVQRLYLQQGTRLGCALGRCGVDPDLCMPRIVVPCTLRLWHALWSGPCATCRR